MDDANLDRLQEILEYRFSDVDLLKRAITHTSHVESNKGTYDFERLEFLGDAVLGMVISELLFTLFPDEQEGPLAQRKSALVCRDMLVEVAQQWQLQQKIRMSDREARSGGAKTETTLEDACEAILGAVYLDGGFEPARRLIRRVWEPLAYQERRPPKDAKTALQEWAQGRGLPLPEYAVTQQSGPAHKPLFTVQVQVKGEAPAEGRGKSKKQATTVAAQALLGQLREAGHDI